MIISYNFQSTCIYSCRLKRLSCWHAWQRRTFNFELYISCHIIVITEWFRKDKINKLRSSILSGTTTSSPHLHPASKPPELSVFHPATVAEVSALLSSSPDTTCDLDPISTSLLKQCKSVNSASQNHKYHQPIYVHWSLPDQFKNCSVHPLLKKSNLNKENLSNYRPISPLSYLSKHHRTTF